MYIFFLHEHPLCVCFIQSVAHGALVISWIQKNVPTVPTISLRVMFIIKVIFYAQSSYHILGPGKMHKNKQNCAKKL